MPLELNAGMNRRQMIRSTLAGCATGLAMARPATAEATPRAAQALLRAYPEHLLRFENNAIVWRDGTRMIWEDAISPKTFDEMLVNADLAEQMAIPYRAGPMNAVPGDNDDPGRLRNQAFFMKMYGLSEAGVRVKLRAVPWPFGANRTLMVTTVNGVDRLVEAIGEQLAAMPPQFHAYVDKPAGGFVWRPVEGVTALSMHSFGIAIDINPDPMGYWRWNPQRDKARDIPFDIVAAFEARKFIWGGKWHHFDRMHVEYRPELFA